MEAIFSVVFFNGERELDAGSVVVFPFLDYKSFQSIISKKIGISPNQFSTYLVRNRSDASRKVPVTGKSNFSAICGERDCFFLVVMRKSRESRARRRRRQTEKPPANLMLLKRSGDVKSVIHIRRNRYTGMDVEKDVRENYLMGIGGGRKGRNEGVLVCGECQKAKETGEDVGFHWCVYDAVTFGFRSPAGPIARPVKGSN